ncbi:monovalent cation/H+ antiporter complex subunit F [Pontimonas sp.]|uniref:monovalent cation/H+ antiporter complex subunit F n=1 Tax=Pontimonas sp. TaxID=2304492 RepID=UPI00286FC482|nr:monovalent cation/H+ antiporter complex subunit F [Pontimonas sp.]MDR9397268.1 monovalent cation/H+ antiporter complex subunit F [Pontimonas sp.]MDR9435076.1 monovalent cation/H+ antiporter complex subunit F [Pontimonas sp.]
MIPDIVVVVVLGLLALSIVFAVVRAWRGPTAGNSAVAGDLIFFAFIGAVAVIGVWLTIDAVMDVILIAALLGFLSVLSLARLIQGSKR